MLALLVERQIRVVLGNGRCSILPTSLLYWGENLKHLLQKKVIDGEEDGSIIVFCSTMIGSGLKVERMKDPLL